MPRRRKPLMHFSDSSDNEAQSGCGDAKVCNNIVNKDCDGHGEVKEHALFKENNIISQTKTLKKAQPTAAQSSVQEPNKALDDLIKNSEVPKIKRATKTEKDKEKLPEASPGKSEVPKVKRAAKTETDKDKLEPKSSHPDSEVPKIKRAAKTETDKDKLKPKSEVPKVKRAAKTETDKDKLKPKSTHPEASSGTKQSKTKVVNRKLISFSSCSSLEGDEDRETQPIQSHIRSVDFSGQVLIDSSSCASRSIKRNIESVDFSTQVSFDSSPSFDDSPDAKQPELTWPSDHSASSTACSTANYCASLATTLPDLLTSLPKDKRHAHITNRRSFSAVDKEKHEARSGQDRPVDNGSFTVYREGKSLCDDSDDELYKTARYEVSSEREVSTYVRDSSDCSDSDFRKFVPTLKTCETAIGGDVRSEQSTSSRNIRLNLSFSSDGSNSPVSHKTEQEVSTYVKDPSDGSDSDFERFVAAWKTPKPRNTYINKSLRDFIVPDDELDDELVTDDDSDDNGEGEDSKFFHRIPGSSEESSLSTDNESSSEREDSPQRGKARKPRVETPEELPDLDDSSDSSAVFETPVRAPKSTVVTPAHRTIKKPLAYTALGVRTNTESMRTKAGSASAVAKPCSFLESLSRNLAKPRDPEAWKFVNHFKAHREELTAKLFKLYNSSVFDGKLPDDMVVTWNVRLLSTAGYCRYRKLATLGKRTEIELSAKVCDTAERVRDTLLHEMCHAAVWLLFGVNDHHGPHWQSFARKATLVYPELPPIKRCHSYKIEHKFIYRCTKCGKEVGRHSKSINTERKVCGRCSGKFELLRNDPTGQGTRTPYVSRAPNRFAIFVKENYGSVKKSAAGRSHKETMQMLSLEFSAKNTIKN